MPKTAPRSFALYWKIDPVKLKRKLIESCPVLIENATPKDKYLLYTNDDTDVDIFNIHNTEQYFSISTKGSYAYLELSSLASLSFAINFIRDFHTTNGISFLDKKGKYRAYMDKFTFKFITGNKREKFMSAKNLKSVDDTVVVDKVEVVADTNNKKGRGRPKKVEVTDTHVKTTKVTKVAEKISAKVASVKPENTLFADLFKVVTKDEEFKEQIKNSSVFTLSHDTLSKVMGEELSPAKVKKVVEHLSEKFTVFQNKETKDIFFFKKAISLKQKNFKA